MRDAVAEFQANNRTFAKRNPELVRYKIARMAEGPFAFYRGTFHLFACDILQGLVGPAPVSNGAGAEFDLVGDVHSENFGTFADEHREVHYDVNDFDETTRGRFGLDVCRLATSHLLAVQDRQGETLERAVQYTLSGIRAYADTVRRILKKAKQLNLDVSESQPSGTAAVDGLIKVMSAVRRPAFVSRLTVWEKGHRRMIRTADYYNVTEQEREQAVRLLADYRKHRTTESDREGFWEVEDVCGRVSGIGSMGRSRYIVLLAGKGSADARNVLLEFKESLPSAYDTCRDREIDGGAAGRRAERVVTMQKWSEAASDPYLGWAVDGEQSFQARQRGPQDERLRFGKLSASAVEGAVRLQGSILARIHGRSAGRAVGPTNPLAELENADAFCQRVLAFALAYADVVRRDWGRFVGARADLERVEGWAGAS